MDDIGCIYMFKRIGGNGWDSITKIYASNRRLYNRFGVRVDVDGDSILVGASGDDGRGSACDFEWIVNLTASQMSAINDPRPSRACLSMQSALRGLCGR
jgi:hypothetical protein